MTLTCPYCGRAEHPETMFFPVGGEHKDLAICVACGNVVSSPPGEGGLLYRPSDERLVAELEAIQRTSTLIAKLAREAREKAEPESLMGDGEGYHDYGDGRVEFCFRESRSETWVESMVESTLDTLGYAGAKHAGGGAFALCRRPCPHKPDYQHARIQIVAIEEQG